MDDSLILWALGVLATVVGLFEFFRRLVLSHAENRRNHEIIIEKLGYVAQVMEDLDDTLKHPDDSGFGVVWLKEEVDEIKEKLDEIEDAIDRRNTHRRDRVWQSRGSDNS